MTASRQLRDNLAIAAVSVVAWIVVTLIVGHISINGGLGSEGRAFGDMVRGFTLKGGDKTTRLSPLFPALAFVPYAITGDVVASLQVVNALSIAVLVLAACLLVDERGLGTGWKWFFAANLVSLIAFAKIAVFIPGRPELCALAAVLLAIAASVRAPWPMVAAAHVASVMALPIGIAAPVFGVARAVRLRTAPARIAAMYAPALLMWLLVQWWARGGVAGILSDFSPRTLVHGLDVWTDSVFWAFALYFFVTSAGGLSILALATPAAWKRLTQRTPETFVLFAVVVLYAVFATFDAPLAFGFLAPVWLLACLETSPPGRQPANGWLAAGLALTLITQRPIGPMDLTWYFVTWHPYDLYRHSAPVQYDGLWPYWIPRFAFVATALWGLTLFRSSFTPDAHAAPDASTRLPSEPSHPPPLPAPPIARDTATPSAVRSDVGLVPILVPEATQTTEADATEGARYWRTIGFAFAIVFGLTTSILLLKIPVQLTDSFTEFLTMQGRSLPDVVAAELRPGPYFRPLRRGLIKVVFDLSGGNYYWWFRGFHALELLALLVLVVRMLRVRSVRDVAVVPLLLATIIGLHTFADVVREAFPVNHFLTIIVCCVGAVNLAQSRGGWLVDAASVALLVFAMGTIETGLLVWVLFVAAYIVGYRGVSRRALALMTIAFASYFVLRFAIIGGSVPSLTERDTGFGLSGLSPEELNRRFGANPWPLYFYNVTSGISSVLFAEPRGGTWAFTKGLLDRDLAPWQIVTVVTSTLSTLLLLGYAVRRRAHWLRFDLNDDDRLVLLFIALLPANAMFTAVYQKDVILSPTGVFYAVAVAVAIRNLAFTNTGARPRGIARQSIVLAVVFAAACGWTWRWIGIQYRLRNTAAIERTEWAYYDSWEAKQRTLHLTTPAQKQIWQTLYDDAIYRRPAPPILSSRFADAWSDPKE